MTILVDTCIFLQCKNVKHHTDNKSCIKLRDGLLHNFNEVRNAQVVKKIYGEFDYCVHGYAKINTLKKKAFTKAVENMFFIKKWGVKPRKNAKMIVKHSEILWGLDK